MNNTSVRDIPLTEWISTIVDVLIVYYLIYRAMLLIRGTRALRIGMAADVHEPLLERQQHPESRRLVQAEAGGSHRDFLHNRIIQFHASDQPYGDEWHVTPEKIAQNASRIEIPTYAFTRSCVQRQIISRIRELEEDVLADEGRFENFLNRQVEAESV